MEATKSLLTSGGIADLLDADPAMVRFVIESRRITPIGLAGQTRVFAPSVVEEIRGIMASMKKRRPRKPVSA